MARKFVIVILLLVLIVVSAPCRTAPAQLVDINGFRIQSDTKIDFPNYIEFHLDVESKAAISKITLNYRVDRLQLIPVMSVAFPEFEPANRVQTSWQWDLTRTGAVPPGTRVNYWWSIEDDEGRSASTEETTFCVQDDAYRWRHVSGDQIDLYWYEGSQTFAERLLDAAGEALDRLEFDIGTSLQDRARIYIYASVDHLQAALIYPQEWTGGVAFTHYGAIAIAIHPGNMDWGKRALAHELAHLVVHQFVFGAYTAYIPTWLDEGLAMYAEGPLDDFLDGILSDAIKRGELLSLRSLASSFPVQPEAAYLAYAQSYSVVDYLLTQAGGRQEMTALLQALKDGQDYETALRTIYDLTVEQLDGRWRLHVSHEQTPVTMLGFGVT